MPELETISLNEVAPGDQIRIQLSPIGITCIPQLAQLLRRNFITANWEEMQRIRRLEKLDTWHQTSDRGFCFFATMRLQPDTLHRAFGGYLEGSPVLIKRAKAVAGNPETEAALPQEAAAQPKATSKPRSEPTPKPEPEPELKVVDDTPEPEVFTPQRVQDLVDIGFTATKLGELLNIRSSAITEWLATPADNLVEVSGGSPAVGTRLLAIAKITNLLISERGFSTEEALAWWSKPSYRLPHKARPGDEFRKGEVKPVRKAAENSYPVSSPMLSAVGA